MRKKSLLKVIGVVMVLSFLVAQITFAAVGTDSTDLRDAVTVEEVREHQAAFQAIADANGGVRYSGSPGYDASADYVAYKMEAAGYEVTIQPFDFPFFQELEPAELEQTRALGCPQVRLSHTILRVETAVTAASALPWLTRGSTQTRSTARRTS